jgi:glutamine synthetase
MDPFAAQPTMLILFCDILDPADRPSLRRDPRSIAKKAEAYMK